MKGFLVQCAKVFHRLMWCELNNASAIMHRVPSRRLPRARASKQSTWWWENPQVMGQAHLVDVLNAKACERISRYVNYYLRVRWCFYVSFTVYESVRRKGFVFLAVIIYIYTVILYSPGKIRLRAKDRSPTGQARAMMYGFHLSY